MTKGGRKSGVAQAKIGAAALISAARKRKRQSANDGRASNAGQASIDGQTLHPQSPDNSRAFSHTPVWFIGAWYRFLWVRCFVVRLNCDPGEERFDLLAQTGCGIVDRVRRGEHNLSRLLRLPSGDR